MQVGASVFYIFTQPINNKADFLSSMRTTYILQLKLISAHLIPLQVVRP